MADFLENQEILYKNSNARFRHRWIETGIATLIRSFFCNTLIKNRLFPETLGEYSGEVGSPSMLVKSI